MTQGRKLTQAEIDSIAHTITPIHIVKEYSQRNTAIFADRCATKMSKKYRSECIDKIRETKK